MLMAKIIQICKKTKSVLMYGADYIMTRFVHTVGGVSGVTWKSWFRHVGGIVYHDENNVVKLLRRINKITIFVEYRAWLDNIQSLKTPFFLFVVVLGLRHI